MRLDWKKQAKVENEKWNTKQTTANALVVENQ